MRLHQKTVEGTSTLADKPPLHGAALSGSAVEAISNGHGLGVYSLEFQNHVESESKRILADTPGIKPKKLAKKVEKAWDQVCLDERATAFGLEESSDETSGG